MAMDSKQKRMSALFPTMPWRGPMVEPSGAVGQDARQAVAFMYSGIAAGGASPSTSILPQMLQMGLYANG